MKASTSRTLIYLQLLFRLLLNRLRIILLIALSAVIRLIYCAVKRR